MVILVDSRPIRTALCLENKRKKNIKELERQGEQVEEGTSKRRDTPATKVVGGEVVIEGNREEWICTLCEDIATEDVVCCQHREK